MNKLKIHHVCIQTSCYKKSLDFYTDILGFNIVSETKGFHDRDYNTWLELDGFRIELQTSKSGDSLNSWSKFNEGIVHLCFETDDVRAELSRIQNLGYNSFKIKNSEILYCVEGGYLFKVKAPEGTEIEIR